MDRQIGGAPIAVGGNTHKASDCYAMAFSAKARLRNWPV
jgi:hypothetical protein